MADLTVTAANVKIVSGSPQSGTSGATITAGQVLYKDAADVKLKLVDNDVLATSEVIGIALNGASDGQPINYLASGTINPGATVVIGTIYVSSPTAGGIAPVDDIVAGDYVSVIGIGLTTDTIKLGILNAGVPTTNAVT